MDFTKEAKEKRFGFTDEQVTKLNEYTKELNDNDIFNAIKEHVYKTAENLFNEAMTIERINNFEKPKEEIYFTEMFKSQLINEFKSSLAVQNEVFKVKPELTTGTKYIDLWIDWIIWDKINGNNEHIINEETNPHPRIFKDLFSFHLFEKLIKGITDQNKLVDCSFIYRQMQNDSYLINEYVGEKEFRDFLFNEYDIEVLEQLKPIHKIGFIEKRKNHYSDCFKLTKDKIT